MMSSVWAALSGVGTLIANIFGYVTQRDAELNAPEMKNALEAKREQEAAKEDREVIEKAFKTKDTSELAKRSSISGQ